MHQITPHSIKVHILLASISMKLQIEHVPGTHYILVVTNVHYTMIYMLSATLEDGVNCAHATSGIGAWTHPPEHGMLVFHATADSGGK